LVDLPDVGKGDFILPKSLPADQVLPPNDIAGAEAGCQKEGKAEVSPREKVDFMDEVSIGQPSAQCP
jgi:hypothetical protein